MTSRARFARKCEKRRRACSSRDYTGSMELRRATYGAAIRLGTVFSTVAVIVAITLDSIGDVSVGAMVAVVAVTGFAASWVQTGRVRRAVLVRPAHRVTMMPLPHQVG